MSSSFKNKKKGKSPSNGIVSKSEQNKNQSEPKKENSSAKKSNKNINQNQATTNLNLSNGKTSPTVSPITKIFNSNDHLIEEENLYLSNITTTYNDQNFLTISNNIKNNPIHLSNKDELSETLLDYINRKLQNLNNIIKTNNPIIQEEFSTQEEDINLNSTLGIINQNNEDGNFTEPSKLDYEITYTSKFTNEEKYKIRDETEASAEKRQLKYSELFRDLKLGLKDVLNSMKNMAQENDAINKTTQSEENMNSRKNSANNNTNSFIIVKQEADLFYNNSNNENKTNNRSTPVENYNELQNIVVVDEKICPGTPKKTDHSEDLKKRLNNLKSASRTNLLMKSNTVKNLTAEKLQIVKKMGRQKTDLNYTMNPKSIKQIMEFDELNDDYSHSKVLDGFHTTQATEKILLNKNRKKNTKMISNGGITNSSLKNEIENVTQRKRFNTQSKAKNKFNPSEGKKEDKSKINLNIETNPATENVKIPEINNQDIFIYKRFNSMDNTQLHNISKNMIQSMPNESLISNSILINSNFTNDIPNSKTSLYCDNENKNSVPDNTACKSVQQVSEFNIENENQPNIPMKPTENSQKNNLIKGILLKENRADKNILPTKSSKPNFAIIPNNMDTIESLACQEESDWEDINVNKNYMISEESVIHQFPVLSINENNLTNDTLKGRNKKIKLERILIHSGSGKQINSGVRLETLENKEKLDQQGPYMLCSSDCSIL